MSFFRDLRVAFHSLMRSKGLAAIVILTLALGIGANAAIFTLVRGVLLKPLVNRDENRLVYIRQSAPGMRDRTTPRFPCPKSRTLRPASTPCSEFGDFSTIGFTMVGLGEPREVHGGVVSGNYFDVMGLHPVLGRLIGPARRRPQRPRRRRSDVSFLVHRLQKRSERASAKPFASAALAIVPRPSSASSNPPCRIPRTPRSSPTSSPARIIFPPRWSRAASIA